MKHHLFRHVRATAFISALCVLMIVGVAQAGLPIGADPVDSFSIVTVDCDSITLTFDEGDAFTKIRVNIDLSTTPDVDFTPSFYEEIFSFGTSITDTAVFTFDSTLTGIIMLNATIEIRTPGSDFPFAEDSTFVELDCTAATSEEPVAMVISSDVIIGCNDGRLNQTLCEPIAMYTLSSDDGIGLDIWEIDPETSAGTPSLYVAAETLEIVFSAGTDTYCNIATSTDGRTGIYFLPDGSMQVINGPDFEDKYFVFTYEDYPSTPTPSTYPGGGLPTPASC